jgi:GT2 family glycosyltransferase
MDRPDLSVIIVHWNTRVDLLSCLESIRRERGALDVEVIVVDNASTDGAVAAVRQAHPEAACIALDRNVGYGAGINVGVERASGRHVLLLNPDTVAVARGIESAVRWMDAHPGAGAAGPLLRDRDGRVERSFGRFPSWIVNTGQWWRGLTGRGANPNPEAVTAPTVVDWVTGACIIVRREAIERGIRFDPGYRLYFEDVDFCRQLRDAGLQVFFVPQPWVLHLRGRAPIGHARRALRRLGESRFHRKHGGLRGRPLAALYWLLGGGWRGQRPLPDRPDIGSVAERRERGPPFRVHSVAGAAQSSGRRWRGRRQRRP